MKSLNVKSLVAVLLIAVCTFVSCKKDKDVASPGSMLEGTWEGMYGVGKAEPSSYFVLVIHSNGTLQVNSGEKDNPYVKPGTWTLDGDVFKAVYGNEEENDYLNLAAKLDEAKTKLSGKWGHGKKNANLGDFFVTRQ